MTLSRAAEASQGLQRPSQANMGESTWDEMKCESKENPGAGRKQADLMATQCGGTRTMLINSH